MQNLKSYQEFESKSNAFVIKVVRDFDTSPVPSPKNKYLNFLVKIFLDVESSSSGKVYQLDDVSFVKYELHSSYKERFPIASSRQNNFEIKVWTYGFYPIVATVFLKYGGSLTVRGNVEFPVSSEEKKLNRGEV